jgi:alpha-mannosidase
MEKLRTAEALAALATSGNNDKLKKYDGLKEAFYYGLGMYSLHGWTADGPIDKHYFAGYMRTNQEKVSVYVDSLCAFGVRELGSRIAAGDNVYFVFNPLGHTRSGLISIPLAEGFNAVRDLETGKTRTGSVHLVNGTSYLKVRIDDVPPAGYKLIRLVNAGIKGQRENFSFSGHILETPFYRVTFTGSGAVASLIDKKTGWEYSSGMLNSLDSAAQDQSCEITCTEKDPDQITLKITGTLPVRHETQMTFYSEDRRIDIKNSINQNFGAPLHWSFNFNIPDPEVWHEETGAIIKAKLASSGGHYADRMARYDYLTLNHFLNVGNSSKNITLSNADCMFFKLGKSTVNTLDQASTDIHVLIGGQVNGDLGVEKQDCDSVFFQHFSILPGDGPFNMARAMNFALDHQNPLLAGKAGTNGDLKQKSYSFVKSSDPAIILWTLKNGEEDGIVMRNWNLGSGPAKAVLGFAGPLEKAWSISHVETVQSELPVNDRTLTVPIRKQQLISLRVKPR